MVPDLEEAYLPGLSVDPTPFVDVYAERSARARRELPWRDLGYGRGAAERLHFFPAGNTNNAEAPLLVFVHGGYWQELTEAESAFAAVDVVARGWAFAALGYGLAPAHGLDEIVAMVRRGVRWLYDNADSLGVDRRRIVLVGHSAGAHLAAMCFGVLPVRAAVLLSGLYELEPLLRTSIGAAIGLSPDEAHRNSPVRLLRAGMPALLAAHGDGEPTGFAEQQDLLVAAARKAGVPVEALVVPDRHHFDLPLAMADPADPLGRRILALLNERTACATY
jgi:arylformamidase